jgi:hypothetical protein
MRAGMVSGLPSFLPSKTSFVYDLNPDTSIPTYIVVAILTAVNNHVLTTISFPSFDGHFT